MFTEQFESILGALDIESNSEFARYAGCDRSYISRIRGGKRILTPESRAAYNLCEGIYSCAFGKGLLKELCGIVGCPPAQSAEEIKRSVAAYLFEGAESIPRDRSRSGNKIRRGLFGSKLNAVMELSEMSNVRLARTANIDTSLVSRYRRGLRTPRANQEITDSICRALLARVRSKNRLDGLAEMIGVEPELLENEEIGADIFKNWFCDFSEADSSVIEDLLEDIERISPDVKIPVPAPEPVDYDETDSSGCYIGEEGLRGCVIRFLQLALKNGIKELLLYSDQNMSWMTSDPEFSRKWLSLMIACINAGAKIRIIHNIDRGLDEMVEAIKKWLPLYMSGRIESFYSVRKNGNRFSHTIFLAGDIACVSSVHISGSEASARYNFYTDPENLKFYQELYSGLMEDCRPLVRVKLLGTDDNMKDEEAVGFSESREVPFDNIKIAITPDSVIVRRLSSPVLDFTVSHPLMRNAFLSYTKHLR